VAVFYGFFIHEVPSEPLPRQTDSTPSIQGNLKRYKRIRGKEERPKITGAQV
jgi:hypothetical protein